jgi:hypothetical protein
MHTHTNWANGDDFPEMAAAWYRDHGYNFVVLTEHNVLSQGEKWMSIRELDSKANADVIAPYRQRFGDSWVETRDGEVRLKPFDEFSSLLDRAGQFLLIPGEEITDKAANGLALHMNASNLSEVVKPRGGSTVTETIVRDFTAAQESGQRTGREVLIAVNHPNYKWAVTAQDLAALPELQFFEVWNGVIDDNDPGDATHASTDEIWDEANALRMAKGAAPLYALANDDSHNYHGNNPRAVPGRAWEMVRSRWLSPESIFHAMKAGDFYASSGVALKDVAYDRSARKLSLTIEAQVGESFVTRFIGVRAGQSKGEIFAEVKGDHPEYTMHPGELYVRAVVTSSAATEVPSSEFRYKRAWTQPIGWR